MSINISSDSVRKVLIATIARCKDRCLQKSCIWGTENLIGLASDLDSIESVKISETLLTRREIIPPEEEISIIYAQSLLFGHEFQRCYHYLLSTSKKVQESRVKSSLGLFLAYYSFYMAGEKIKDQFIQESIVLDSPASTLSTSKVDNVRDREATAASKEYAKNPFLNEVYYGLLHLYQENRQIMDGYLLYLFGVVARDHNRQNGGIDRLEVTEENSFLFKHRSESSSQQSPTAKELFVQAIRAEPMNWSCWLELSEHCLVDELERPTLEELTFSTAHERVDTSYPNEIYEIMYMFFLGHVYNEMYDGNEAMKCLRRLDSLFPRSNELTSQIARAQYTARDYEDAQQTYETIRQSDPYRLEGIDLYSNILYVKELKADLSYLAHSLMKTNKYSPETCCVIGNYYSLKGQHEKAILYCSRALKLNSKFQSAWTLIGHECLELRNTSAAVQCYQRATRLNRLDYRAWYGLGQTYEMLHMFSYALYYYNRATTVRRNDSRIWCGVGSCYQHLGQAALAIQAYEHAVKYDDREGFATIELAKLYRQNEDLARAVTCYLKHWIAQGYVEAENYHVTRVLMDLKVDTSLAEAFLFVAKYFHERDYVEHAEEYCSILLDYVGPEGDEARAKLRELRHANTSRSRNEVDGDHSGDAFLMSTSGDDIILNLRQSSSGLRMSTASTPFSSASTRIYHDSAITMEDIDSSRMSIAGSPANFDDDEC